MQSSGVGASEKRAENQKTPIKLIHPVLLRGMLHIIEPKLRHVVEQFGFDTWEGIIREAYRGRAEFWRVGDSTYSIMTFREDPAGNLIATGAYIGGEGMGEWLPDILECLRNAGEGRFCTELNVCGRAGWKRALRAHGYKEKRTIMAFPL